MMGMAATRPAKGWKKTLLSALWGAAIGGGSVTALLWLGGDDLLDAMDGSRIALAATGLIYLLIAAIIGFGLAAPRAGAKVLNVQDAEDLVDQRPKLLVSLLYMAVLGLALMLLALARGPGFAGGPVPSAVALAGMAVLLAASLASILWMRVYDELDRQMGIEGGAWAFFIAAGVLIPWSTLDTLGWNVPLRPLDVVTVLAAALLAGSFAAVGRRGMLTV